MKNNWKSPCVSIYKITYLTKEQKNQYRADLFRHLDGIVTAPIAYALYQKGILRYLIDQKQSILQELAKHFDANEGYLNVAIHTLASQGWLSYEIHQGNVVSISITPLSKAAFDLVPLYKDVVELLQLSGKYHSRRFEVEPFKFLDQIFQKFKERYGLIDSESADIQKIQDQILKHIEGIIVGPTIVALGMSGMFHKYFMEASFRPEEFHNDSVSFAKLLDIFVYLRWFTKSNGTYSFTDKGIFYARRASAYGVTVSYIPTFRMVDELLYGDPTIFWNQAPGSKEIHVDREMNVWGSGGAHSAYFKVVDDIIINLFNQPIEQQPKGIIDIGCGNGAFLIHLYDVIEQRTLRGKLLEEHPLFLVGADYNQAALKVTRSNIIQADIWAKLIWGDISQPELIAQDLMDNYGIQLGELLNVRTFLDHNRIWSDPSVRTADRASLSRGAYAYRGRYLSNEEVEDNLREHLYKWSQYVQRYGLLVIELHTIAPDLTAANLGKTAATAYNATHGFSDQYIVEIDVFHKVAAEVGLYPDMNHFTKFPNNDLASVSINLLKQKT